MAIMSFTSWDVLKRFALMRPRHAKIYSDETKCSVKNIIIYGCLSRSPILRLPWLGYYTDGNGDKNQMTQSMVYGLRTVNRMSFESKTTNVSMCANTKLITIPRYIPHALMVERRANRHPPSNVLCLKSEWPTTQCRKMTKLLIVFACDIQINSVLLQSTTLWAMEHLH